MEVGTIKLWTREDELKLEALVQLGVQSGQVEECHFVYLSNTSAEPGKMKACLIGTAMIGKFGDKDIAFVEYKKAIRTNTAFGLTESGYIDRLSSLLGINGKLLLRASYRHMSGVTIAEQLADLRADCYN